MDSYLIFLAKPLRPEYPYTPIRCAHLVIEQGRLRAIDDQGQVVNQWPEGEWERVIRESRDDVTSADIPD